MYHATHAIVVKHATHVKAYVKLVKLAFHVKPAMSHVTHVIAVKYVTYAKAHVNHAKYVFHVSHAIPHATHAIHAKYSMWWGEEKVYMLYYGEVDMVKTYEWK
jgi:hypothetical protein